MARLVVFTDADNNKIAVDADFVAYLGPAFTQSVNAATGRPNGPKSLVIGKSTIVTHTGQQIVVDGGVEQTYGRLRKGEGGSPLVQA